MRVRSRERLSMILREFSSSRVINRRRFIWDSRYLHSERTERVTNSSACTGQQPPPPPLGRQLESEGDFVLKLWGQFRGRRCRFEWMMSNYVDFCLETFVIRVSLWVPAAHTANITTCVSIQDKNCYLLYSNHPLKALSKHVLYSSLPPPLGIDRSS